MNITEHEMRGLLTGKCLPGDMRVNEELPAYLVRKFAELKAQRDALASENAALKSAIVIAKEGLQEHYDTDGVDSQDNEGNFMDACIRLCDAQSTIEKLEGILTPATAAYLNSVRADAVASFAHHQRVIADSETDPTIQRGHRITACRAEDFAAQLRAGKDGE